MNKRNFIWIARKPHRYATYRMRMIEERKRVIWPWRTRIVQAGTLALYYGVVPGVGLPRYVSTADGSYRQIWGRFYRWEP